MLTIVKDPFTSKITSAVDPDRCHDQHRRQPYCTSEHYGLPMPFSVFKVRNDSLQTFSDFALQLVIED